MYIFCLQIMNLFSHLERVFIFFLLSRHILQSHASVSTYLFAASVTPPTHFPNHTPSSPTPMHFYFYGASPFKTVSFRKSASEGWSFKAEVYFNFGCLFYVLNTCGICNGHILGFTSLSSRLCWLWIRSWNVEKTFSEPPGLLHHRFFDLRSRRDDWESISAESR